MVRPSPDGKVPALAESDAIRRWAGMVEVLAKLEGPATREPCGR
jgi:hypothetical protein